MRRRDLLKSAMATLPMLSIASSTETTEASGSAPSLAGMNVLVILTDQERAIQHFPPGWSQRNLPGLTYLQVTVHAPSGRSDGFSDCWF